MQDAPDSIGSRIKELAAIFQSESGIPLTGFATMVGVPYSSLQNYVRSERVPSAAVLQALVENTGVSAKWLLTGAGPRFQSDVLDKPIVDKVLIVLLNDVLDRCVKNPSSPLTAEEKSRLMSYMASRRTLGLRDAVKALFDVGAIDQIDELPRWTDALKDMASPSPKGSKRRPAGKG